MKHKAPLRPFLPVRKSFQRQFWQIAVQPGRLSSDQLQLHVRISTKLRFRVGHKLRNKVTQTQTRIRGIIAWRRYLIQRVAGSCTSWELHRLEERLWGSRAAILHRPHRSGALSHTSPSICGEKKGDQTSDTCSSGCSVHATSTRGRWATICLK